MAQEQRGAGATLTVSAKIGGASMVLGLVSVAHAMSHAYGALLPLILPSLQQELGLTEITGYSEGAVMQTALADVAGKASIAMLFGLYFTIGATIGAPWALLLGILVDAYGFPAAFAAMGLSQIVAGLCILPVRLRTARTA